VRRFDLQGRGVVGQHGADLEGTFFFVPDIHGNVAGEREA
jgi:hypothetical protein